MTHDTIVALATGRGGAIAVIRVSGPAAISVVDGVFAGVNGRSLADAAGYSVHFGRVVDTEASVSSSYILPPPADESSTTPGKGEDTRPPLGGGGVRRADARALDIDPASAGLPVSDSGNPFFVKNGQVQGLRETGDGSLPGVNDRADFERNAAGGRFSGKTVDEVLVTVFRGPHSYTGEDVV